MVDGKHKITSFEDLTVWREAQELAVSIYEVTNKFPTDEKFALTNQLRRAASSVSANIAEGFGRTTIKDKLNFYSIAYGSLLETKNFTYLAKRLNFIDQTVLDSLLAQSLSCQKLINALKRSLRQ